MVEKAQERALQPLKDRRLGVENEAKSIVDELQEEVVRLEQTISELHSMTLLEDHVLCLQVGGCCKLSERSDEACSSEILTFSIPFSEPPIS